MLSSFLRSNRGRVAAKEFVNGKRGIRSLINETQSERVRSELYRLERLGVQHARPIIKRALRTA